MTMFRRSVLGAALAAVLCVSSAAAESPADFKAGGLTFKRPEKFAWVEITPGMRAAELKVEEDGKKGEVIFFVFPAGAGGGVQANIDRWFGMFQEGKDKINAKTEKVKQPKGEITYAQAEGTYLSGMPGGPKTPQPGSMLLGAILEGPQSNVFVRMTGPAALVKKHEANFRTMIESALK